MNTIEVLTVDLERAHERAWKAAWHGDQAGLAIALGQAQGIARRLAAATDAAGRPFRTSPAAIGAPTN